MHNLFSSSTRKVTRINKNGEEIIQISISYRLQFIYNARFMVGSLPSLVKNLAYRIHKIKCKYKQGDKKCET